MKKRILFVAIVLVTLLVCMVGCKEQNANLDTINSLLQSGYSKVTVNVTTQNSKVTLVGVYNLTFDSNKTNVSYSFDKLNTFDIDDGNFSAPNSVWKTTVTGNAVIENGSIVEGDSTVDLPIDTLNFSGLSFKAENLAKVTMSNVKLQAEVKDVKAFVGSDSFQCSNMSVTVLFSAQAISKIELTYTANDSNASNVTVVYLFTK